VPKVSPTKNSAVPAAPVPLGFTAAAKQPTIAPSAVCNTSTSMVCEGLFTGRAMQKRCSVLHLFSTVPPLFVKHEYAAGFCGCPRNALWELALEVVATVATRPNGANVPQIRFVMVFINDSVLNVLNVGRR
jgi:hypothetical protein